MKSNTKWIKRLHQRVLISRTMWPHPKLEYPSVHLLLDFYRKIHRKFLGAYLSRAFPSILCFNICFVPSHVRKTNSTASEGYNSTITRLLLEKLVFEATRLYQFIKSVFIYYLSCHIQTYKYPLNRLKIKLYHFIQHSNTYRTSINNLYQIYEYKVYITLHKTSYF